MASRRARSAGLLLYRLQEGRLEVLLAHMGGPFWAGRDAGAWTLPKGEHQADEEPLTAARREFQEEMGSAPPQGPVIPLGEVRQPSGKRIAAWAVRADFDPDSVRSNTFELEWPPRSGTIQEFPEVDRAAWFDVETARAKLVGGQVPFLDQLLELVVGPRSGA